MTATLKYLQHYPLDLQDKIRQLQAQNSLGDYITQRYLQSHTIQTDKVLYEYCNEIKQEFLRNTPLLDKVIYDNRLSIEHHAGPLRLVLQDRDDARTDGGFQYLRHAPKLSGGRSSLKARDPAPSSCAVGQGLFPALHRLRGRLT